MTPAHPQSLGRDPGTLVKRNDSSRSGSDRPPVTKRNYARQEMHYRSSPGPPPFPGTLLAAPLVVSIPPPIHPPVHRVATVERGGGGRRKEGEEYTLHPVIGWTSDEPIGVYSIGDVRPTFREVLTLSTVLFHPRGDEVAGGGRGGG